MDTLLTTVLSILTAVGVGGVLGAYFQSRFQQRTQIGQHQHDLKQRRYMCILILMLTKLDPATGMPKLREIRPDLKSSDDIDNELATELLNGFIFASDGVLESLADFMRNSDHRSFFRTAGAMRKDLWGKRSQINEEILSVIEFPKNSDHIKVSHSHGEELGATTVKKQGA